MSFFVENLLICSLVRLKITFFGDSMNIFNEVLFENELIRLISGLAI